MKIRTDFVTNSISSGSVTMSVTLNNGSVIEQEYSMDDIGFHESLYTLTKEEITELLSRHHTIGELIDKLDEFYDGMFRGEEEDALGEITFADISKVAVSDKWAIDGDEGGVLLAEYSANSWSMQWLSAEDENYCDEDEEDDYDPYDRSNYQDIFLREAAASFGCTVDEMTDEMFAQYIDENGYAE